MTHLYLDNNSIDELQHNMHMPNLQVLSLNYNRLSKLFDSNTGEAFMTSKALPNLHTLELAHNKLYLLDSAAPGDEAAPTSLKLDLPNLQALFLDHNSLNCVATYQLVAKMTALDTLNDILPDEQEGDVETGIDSDTRKKNSIEPEDQQAETKPLESGKMDEQEVEGEGAETAVGQITEAETEMMLMRDAEGSALGNLPKLSVLSLRANDVYDLDGLIPSAIPHLEYLNLRENKITTLDELDKLRKLSQLRTLILQDNPIFDVKDYRLEVRVNLQTLRRLDKDNYSIEENEEADAIAEQRRMEKQAAEASVDQACDGLNHLCSRVPSAFQPGVKHMYSEQCESQTHMTPVE